MHVFKSHTAPRLHGKGSRTVARCWPQRKSRSHDRCLVLAAKTELEADVVIVGAGIIGLLTAQALLRRKQSVILVERKQLCAGATGAGQGYIWMAHRTADSPSWELAASSTTLWRKMVRDDQGLATAVEWQDTGSLLLACTREEVSLLRDRVNMLHHHGVKSQLLDANEVTRREPALHLPPTGAGLLVTSDAQINGRKTAAALLESCHRHGKAFQHLMDEPVGYIQCQEGAPHTHTVVTSQHRLKGRQGTVVSAGVWTGDLLAKATGEQLWRAALTPRRGHLCEVQRPTLMAPLKLGVMEMSYTKHYATHHDTANPSSSPTNGVDVESQQQQQQADITFTATTSASGSLLIGSSREVGALDPVAQPDVVAAIMERAVEFIPALSQAALPYGEAIRVGPRPYAVGGLPIIGPVPDQPGLYVAAGHEGSGLCMGPATAELVVQHVMHERPPLQEPPPSMPHWQDEFRPEVRLLLASL